MVVSRKSSELKPGDIVVNYGMRIRIDAVREVEDESSYGGRYYSCPGTVLNLADVAEMEIVPLGWLRTQKFVEGTGWVTDRTDYWTVQGNDLATWGVESCPCGYPGTVAECAQAAQTAAVVALDAS